MVGIVLARLVFSGVIFQFFMSGKKGDIRIGTSGWSYKWKDFYPADIQKKDYLKYFSFRFNTAEVNYSFYQLPDPGIYEKWAGETREDFRFTLKLSRYITHIKRLKEVKEYLRNFLKNAASLKEKRGPILVQLPPNFKLNTERLEHFLKSAKELDDETGMKTPTRYAFEFRHGSWFEEGEERRKAVEILSSYNACFVFGHSSKYPYPSDEPLTADFVYFRFHGPGEFAASEYGSEKLSPFADRMLKLKKQGHDVYVYFNNDVNGYATRDAHRLMGLVSG